MYVNFNSIIFFVKIFNISLKLSFMIAYIKGPLSFKSPTNVIIDINGVGYHINISLFTYSKLEQLEEVKLLTHLMIKEDSHSLYGFFDETEKNLFLQLISVSGIGATTAQLVLSALNPDQVKTAIIQDQDSTFSKVKGIGPKTAKRIILDLKDKISKEPVMQPTHSKLHSGRSIILSHSKRAV